MENKWLSNLFRITVCLGVTVFIITLAVFIVHGHLFLFTDIDKDYFGIFGDFTAGVVGTLFSIATTVLVYQTFQTQKKEVAESKLLTQMQMALTIKPDLYFKNASVNGFSKKDINGNEYAWSFSNKRKFDEQYGAVKVELINIGVGVAKRIEYEWAFDLEAVQAYIVDKFPDHPLVIDPDIDQKTLVSIKLRDIEQELVHGQKFYKIPHRVDLLQSANHEQKGVSIYFPFPYLFFYFLALKLTFNSEYQTLGPYSILEDFPSCCLKLKYHDIANNEHKKTFQFLFIGNAVLWSKSLEDGELVCSYTIQPNEI